MDPKPYYYIRFRWFNKLNIEKISEKLEDSFEIDRLNVPTSDKDLTLYKKHREELKVKADTLIALLSLTRAILYQKDKNPFTKKDMELREKLFELYPRSRVTPLPMLFSDEPKFEVEE